MKWIDREEFKNLTEDFSDPFVEQVGYIEIMGHPTRVVVHRDIPPGMIVFQTPSQCAYLYDGAVVVQNRPGGPEICL